MVTVLPRIGCGYKSKNYFFQFIAYGGFFSINVQSAIQSHSPHHSSTVNRHQSTVNYAQPTIIGWHSHPGRSVGTSVNGHRVPFSLSTVNCQLSRHFLKPLVIILPRSAHQPIPKGKVQAIVALEVLVVLVVVYRSIEPFAQPMAVGTLGKEFIAEVAIYIVQRHEYQKYHDVRKMNGDGKGKYIDDARFYHGFGGTKGKRGPRRWVRAFVVQQVKEFKQLGMVHEAVRKIKIRIVHKQHHRKDEDIIGSAVFAEMAVKSSVWFDRRMVEHQWYQGKNNEGDERENHFAAVIAALWPTCLNFL